MPSLKMISDRGICGISGFQDDWKCTQVGMRAYRMSRFFEIRPCAFILLLPRFFLTPFRDACLHHSVWPKLNFMRGDYCS